MISRATRVPSFRWSQRRTEVILPNLRAAGKGRGSGGREGRVPLYKWVSRGADFPSRKQPAVGHCGYPTLSFSALSLLSPKQALLIKTTTEKSHMLTSSSTEAYSDLFPIKHTSFLGSISSAKVRGHLLCLIGGQTKASSIMKRCCGGS